MLDGLRREFPEVVTLVGRIPHPRVGRAPIFWSVMAAFGAALFVSALVTMLFSFLLRPSSSGTPFPAPFELARLAGTAAALGVAWTAGGPRAVAGYVGLVIVESLLGLPSRIRFCEMAGADPAFAVNACSMSRYLIGLWPQLLGAGLALALGRWVRARPGDRNPALEGAGVFTLVQGVGGAIIGAAFGPAAAGSPEWPLSFVLLAVAAGIAAGFTILRKATRMWRTMGIVALVVLGEYMLLSVPLFLSQVLQARGTSLVGPFDVLAYFSPVFAMAAAAAVLYIASARRVTPAAGA